MCPHTFNTNNLLNINSLINISECLNTYKKIGNLIEWMKEHRTVTRRRLSSGVWCVDAQKFEIQ